jgi:hypothetical protein
VPRVLRADSRHDQHDRGGDPGGDRVAGPAQQGDRQGAGADKHCQRPRVERQEGQVDQAQHEADQGGRHAGHCGGDALLIALPKHEERGDHGPQAAEERIGPGRRVQAGQQCRDKPVGDQARDPHDAAFPGGCQCQCPAGVAALRHWSPPVHPLPGYPPSHRAPRRGRTQGGMCGRSAIPGTGRTSLPGYGGTYRGSHE